MSFCSLNAEAQAAWAQAVMSVIAIAVAIWLPRLDRRADLRHRLDVYAELISGVADQARSDVQYVDNATATHSKPGRDEGIWDRLIASLAAVPRHEVPDFRLIYVLDSSLELAVACRQYWKDILDSDNDADCNRARRFLNSVAIELTKQADKAAEIRNEYGSHTVIGAIRYWQFQRKRAARDKARRKAGKTSVEPSSLE